MLLARAGCSCGLAQQVAVPHIPSQAAPPQTPQNLRRQLTWSTQHPALQLLVQAALQVQQQQSLLLLLLLKVVAVVLR
jgi:hypothetical protein